MWQQGTLGNGITRYRYTYTIVHKKRNHCPTSRSTGTGRTNAQKAVFSDEGDKVTTSRVELGTWNVPEPVTSLSNVDTRIPTYYTYLPMYVFQSNHKRRPNARRTPRAFDFPTTLVQSCLRSFPSFFSRHRTIGRHQSHQSHPPIHLPRRP